MDKNTHVTEIEEAFKSFCSRDGLLLTFFKLSLFLDIAIILINQHIAEMIRYQVDQHIASIPTVLEIPSKEMPYDASKVPSLY